MQLANKLGVTQATMWARLNNKSDRDIQLSVFYEMVDALGYDLVLRKKTDGTEEQFAEVEEYYVEIDIPTNPKRRGRPRIKDME
ncbi:MAG: hypothetical protein MJ142_01270 [Clostridia bacterium]|nr:hypothetical protein [Clostridia bacterium]